MQTISRTQLKAKLDAGEDIKLVMTVGGWTFRAGHIPGSLALPSPRRALETLGCDDEIIVYSSSNGRRDTQAAVDALTAHGFSRVRCYVGGLADWEAAGYPVEGTSVGSATDRPWPHGHSPQGTELEGACPHCDNGWSGYGWPPAEGGNRRCRDGVAGPTDRRSEAVGSGMPVVPAGA